MIDSGIAISKFNELINCTGRRGFINLFVIATVNNKKVYEDYADCMFSYNAQHSQNEINIDWSFNDSVMNSLGLHAKYNSNFQTFSLKGHALHIEDNTTSIELFKR